MDKKLTYEELLAENKKLSEENTLLKNQGINQAYFKENSINNQLAPIAIIDWDINFHVCSWNESAKDIFGYTANEALGKHAVDIIVPQIAREQVDKIWNNLIKNKGGLRSSNFNSTKSGQNIFCEWYNIPLEDCEGKVIGVKSFVFDISITKRAEQALIESEERFKSLSYATFEALIVLDDGYCVEINKAGCNLFGYSYKEAIGMFASDVFAEESKALVLNNIRSGHETPYEAVAIKKDGTKFIAEIRGKSIRYKNKNLRVTALRDISRRKKMELELIESENKFRTIIENAGDGILIGNSKGEIIDMNASFCAMSGYSEKDLINKHVSTLFSEETLKEKPLRFDLVDIGQSIIIKREIITKEGKSLLVEMNSKRQKNDCYISIIRDLTERIKVEEELRKTNKKLLSAVKKAEESEQLKTEFLANMSHEIRTPMNGIIGFSEMLNEPDLEKDQIRHFTNIIINSGKQLKQIIDDILEISVLETKQVKVIQDQVSLNSILLETFSVYDTKAKNNKTPLYIYNGLNDKQSIIYTDDVKLKKILNNLIDNALHYTSEGYIEMGYSLKENKIEFYVKDTGMGIDEMSQKLIFERFSQGDKSLSRKFGGLGLGLSIAKENTELLGGRIWVESEIGKGSTFRFSIPYNSVYDVDPNDETQKIINNVEREHKYTILIAEDEEINYVYYYTIISKSLTDFKILHAKDGQEAIDICKKDNSIDIILMDIKMPGINGLEATREIKSIVPEIRIIAQTAYTRVEDKNLALSAGCCEFISKPIDKNALIGIIKKHMDIEV